MGAASSSSGDITLTWKLHEAQRKAFEQPARFRTCAWGRRAGKNIFANVDQVDYALDNASDPHGSDGPASCWWVAPTYTQAHDYGWGEDANATGATDLLPDELIADRKKTDPRRLTLANGATISYRTFDHPESLDGAGVDHIVIDEAAQMPSKIWSETLRPMLADTGGKAVFISKPKGKNWFYEFFQRGESDEWPEYWSSQVTSYANPFVANDEIDAAARSTPDRIFKQEYLAVFLDSGSDVFAQVRQRNGEEYDWQQRNGNGPYTWGWDFARHQNWTVGVCLDRDGLLVDFWRDQPATWPALQKVIEMKYDKYAGAVRVDASRDNKIVQDLEAAGLPVDAVNFSSEKNDLVENLAVRLEAGELTLPDIGGEVEQLWRELEMYDYEVTPAENVSYGAPAGWHDDAVDALALAAKPGGPRRLTWGE